MKRWDRSGRQKSIRARKKPSKNQLPRGFVPLGLQKKPQAKPHHRLMLPRPPLFASPNNSVFGQSGLGWLRPIVCRRRNSRCWVSAQHITSTFGANAMKKQLTTIIVACFSVALLAGNAKAALLSFSQSQMNAMTVQAVLVNGIGVLPSVFVTGGVDIPANHVTVAPTFSDGTPGMSGQAAQRAGGTAHPSVTLQMSSLVLMLPAS